MTHRPTPRWKALLGASALALLAPTAAPALAGAAQPFDLSVAPSGADTARPEGAPGLVRLPAGASELAFNQENPHRTYPVFVTGEESTKPAELTVGYSSTVTIAPESSSITVLVNDEVVAERPLTVGSDQRFSVAVPAGLLQAGFNAVQIMVRQFHRVDCSAAGTYELWTRLDPATTGLRFAQTASRPSDLGELPALARSLDGEVALNVLSQPGATTEATGRALSAVQSLALLGRFANPRVHLGGTPAGGIDVMVGTFEELAFLSPTKLAPNTPWSGVFFLPTAPSTGRPALVVTGAGQGDVDSALAALAKGAREARPNGSVPGLTALANSRGRPIDAGQSASFAEFGGDTRPFPGHVYRDEVALTLPADFYPANYDTATVVLNAVYAAGLSSEAMLFVRANDQIVATLHLSSPRAGQIKDQRLRLPLEVLKPGANRISFEALVPRAGDATCEGTASNEAPRFALLGTTRIDIPSLARIGHYPNLSATLAGLSDKGEAQQPLSVYAPGGDAVALEAAATMLARMAGASGTVRKVQVVRAMPHEESGDLLAVGTYSALPPELISAVERRGASADAGSAGLFASLASILPAEAAGGGSEPSPMDILKSMDKAPPGADGFLSAFSQPGDLLGRAGEIVQPLVAPIASAAQKWSAAASPQALPLPGDAFVLAQVAAPIAPGAAWTVLAAPTREALAEGSRRLGEPGVWRMVAGARTEIPSAADGALRIAQGPDERLFETQGWTVGNARLVLAGWFSRHSERYAGSVMGASLLLALSTFLLLRRVGEKSK
ncbi:cellulose biosynthesis cyclic di-GMP-binding regulatory protein BcsB [Aureimonas sp. AU20]|uniref:cellulose biosynthesis cyclic di-GMP-binding regulatory protein BcsB n=1 Tax=Aureimonas sp. AU20 TaxID=1349819 RepID=UPI000722F56A|nr:cellulose biosynthesis cyclic di-GMP-binding regulatory protein BcsB [Aureimonas sp. AU20]ALN73085.1 hypothetical protein M673_10165 [Aureimonas sp. AU20]